MRIRAAAVILAILAMPGSLSGQDNGDAGISVTPSSAQRQVAASEAWQALGFVVRNGGPHTEQVVLSCVTSGVAGDCDVSEPVISVSVGDSARVYVRYKAASAGSGTVRLDAKGVGSEAMGEYSVDVGAEPRPVSKTVETSGGMRAMGPTGPIAYVTPKGQSVQVSAGTHQATFYVENQGDDGTIDLFCGHTGYVTGCSLGVGDVYLQWSDVVPITVTYTTSGTSPSGTVTLTGWTPSNGSNVGSYNVSPASAPAAPLVDVASVNPGVRHDRSACVITSTGPATAYQCGDLIATHSLASYYTMNRDRSLTLFYNSSTAQVWPLVRAKVRNTGSPADSLVATLTLNGVQTRRRFATAVSGGAPVQIAVNYADNNLATGVYPYTLAVSNYYSGIAYTTNVGGEVIVVNRSSSPYGRGWSVAGVEQIYTNQRNNAILLVQADGSGAVYESIGSSRYLAPAGEYRDTIVYGVTDPGLQTSYRRRTLGGTEVYYNGAGKQTWVQDRVGNRVQYTYVNPGDAASGLQGVRVAPWGQNRVYTFAYDGNGKLDYIQDPGGRVTQVTVSGNLTGIKDPGMSWVNFGYSSGRITSRTSVLGHATSYSYWPSSNKIRQVTYPWLQGRLYTNYFKSEHVWGLWTTAGTVPVDSATAKVEFTRGQSIARFVVNGSGMPVRAIDPMGATTKIVYGQNANVPALPNSVELPNGRIIKYIWNSTGTLQERRDSTLHLPNGKATVRTAYAYHSTYKDQPTQITEHATGLATTLTYQAPGLLATVTAPGGHVTRYSYVDTLNIPKLLRDVKEESVLTMTGIGVAETAQHLTTSFRYNALGNLVSEISPLGRTQTFTRDGYGRVSDAYDPAGHRTQFVYDSINRIVQSIEHDGATQYITRRFYTGTVLDSILDPRSVVRKYQYDALDRLTDEIDEYGNRDIQYLNRFGVADSTKTRMGLVNRYAYDLAGRKTSTTWPGRPHPDLWFSVNGGSEFYTYDPLTGAMLTANNGVYKITRTYFPDGSLKSEVQQNSNNSDPYSHVYSYDLAGRRIGYKMGSGDSISYRYNSLTGHLQTVRVQWAPGSTIASDSVRFVFDGLGRRKQALYSPHSNSINVRFAYDADGNQRRICSTSNGSATPNVFTFRHAKTHVDAEGLVRSISGASDSFCTSGTAFAIAHSDTIDYDRRHQMVRNGLFDFTYDASGNLTGKLERSNGLPTNLPVSVGSNRLAKNWAWSQNDYIRYTYFADGARRDELTYVNGSRVASPSDRWYVYDARGRNTGFLYYDQGQLIVDTSACLYDPVGRLRKPCENTAASIGFDGDNTVRTAPDANSGWTFVHGPGTDDPIMGRYRTGSSQLFAYWVTDGAGRQYAVGNSYGTDLSTHTYYASTGKFAGGITSANSFGADRFKSASTPGLSFFRNRFYDQNTGRWTQEDPLGIAAGTNMYAYVGNNPVTFTDPFGLCIPWPQCALAAGRVGAAAGTLVGAGVGALGAGAGAVPGAAIGNRVGWLVGAGAATAGAVYMAGKHALGADRVNTSLGIVNEHLGRVAAMPPDDDDPQFVRDMVNHAQKHLNNARKYVRKVSGKTRDELQRQIDDAQRIVDRLRGGIQ